MDATERWRRVKSIVADALERPAGERRDFVRQAVEGDTGLRGEVESLLAACEAAGDRLERPAAAASVMAAAGVPLPAPPVHLKPGDRLGPYEILEPIGAGGMGEVYRARDVRLDRTVAIKVLPLAAARQPDARARFEREARTISRLNHPHICALYDVGVHDGVDFLVMEHLEGETLARRIERGPMPLDALVPIAMEIVGALDRAHRQGVVHCDLKPGNVILAEQGAKLLDFGIARLLGGLTPDDDAIAGTRPYMSPEQYRGEPVDERSDVFSLGALIFEMATGMPALRQDRKRSEAAVTPPLLARIVEKAMADDPRARYQHARDLRSDLQRLTRTGIVPWGAGRVAVLAAATVAVLTAGVLFILPRAGQPAAPPSVRSVSVLPFKPLAPGSDEDHIGVALAEAVVLELGSVRAISVKRIANGSPHRVPGSDPVAAGRDLGVELIVDGAIQRAGDRVQVAVTLVRVSDGATVWKDRFDSKWSDIFRVQDTIVEQVTRALSVRLTGEQRQALARRRARNTEAYEAYLKGRYFWNTRSADGFTKALAYFQQAIDRDPEYASAHAGLADTYALLGSMPYAVLPASEAGPKARDAATRALALDETLAEAHVSLAFVTYAFDWDWARGEREFRRAIELDPEYPTAHYWYSMYLAQVGRGDEALLEAQRAVDLEPLSLVGTYAVGLAHHFARRHDTARAYANKALEITPGFAPGRRLLASAYIAEKRYDEAIRELVRLRDETPGNSLHAALLAHAYGRAGQRGKALAIARELAASERTRIVSPANLAHAYSGVGDLDAAMAWLEKGYADHAQALTFLFADPIYDVLRADARFQDLSRRVGLPVR